MKPSNFRSKSTVTIYLLLDNKHTFNSVGIQLNKAYKQIVKHRIYFKEN